LNGKLYGIFIIIKYYYFIFINYYYWLFLTLIATITIPTAKMLHAK
jgi:hypothetical protein